VVKTVVKTVAHAASPQTMLARF